MANPTKTQLNKLARKRYGEKFDYLTSGQKAQISKDWKAETSDNEEEYEVAGSVVVATIGRVGQNGLKTCSLNSGAKISDLVDQAKIIIDNKKESIQAKSTGRSVTMTTKVVDNETYFIVPEVKSA